MHLFWPTVMHAFRDQAREVVDASLHERDAVGIGEDPSGQAAPGNKTPTPADGRGTRSVAHRLHRRPRGVRAAGPGRGPQRRRRAGLARHHPADLEKEHHTRRHRCVRHLPRRDPHQPAAHQGCGRPLPRDAAGEQDALGGPAPHHRRGPRPTRKSHRSEVVGPLAPAAQP
ncbi:hypothetical protein SBRY_40157 [Actinacidiphila bryophytorum]|uniref:Uncharacterized protein n=1 Tax=Actinacidiphila bryophytorum TaxID=1436133 RepID=A0A9W4H2E3_9ACTN|nr:hypothetical protein SBRY_40157 [Actinacidiphila bryophytorum]